jgi:apolipoprotein N-acyltransferase
MNGPDRSPAASRHEPQPARKGKGFGFSLTHWPWPALIVLPVAGALASLSLPPFRLWPLLPLAFWPLLRVLADLMQRPRPLSRVLQGALATGVFGLGWFGASVWWVGEAFLVDAERFAAVMPLAVLFMTLLLSAFWALPGAVYAYLRPRRALPAAALLASAWMLAGHLRGCCVFGGFPWNLPAHAGAAVPWLDQSVALIGVEGLSWLTVFLAATPALLATPALPGRRALAAVAAALVMLAVGWGLWRLSAHPPRGGDVMVRIVQPAVPQREKWRPENRARIFDDLLRLTAAPAAAGGLPAVIVWPESAVPFLLDEEPEALSAIARVLRPGQVLLTGALRRAGLHGAAARALRNAVLAIDSEGRITGVYDKRHLVPFGEYLPAAWLLEPLGLRRLVPLPRGFLPGAKDQAPLPAGRAGRAWALVCYEAIFPRSFPRRSPPPPAAAGEGTFPPSTKKPRESTQKLWVVNVTNDAWFGRSIGPHQHLEAARLRALEAGLPLVRAANTGISAVYDALGREYGRLGLIRRGVLDVALPHAGPRPAISPYGSIPLLALSLLLVLGAVMRNLGMARKDRELRRGRP